MEFKINKNEFLKGLRLAQSIADRKSTMPMLANTLIRIIDSEKLMVAATDLNVSVIVEIPCKATGEGGLTLGAKALHDMVSNAPGEEIVLKKAQNNWAEISSDHVNYRVVGMPDRDFPKIPDATEQVYSEIDAELLRDMIDKTLYSISNDETRYHLNGVLFECDGDTGRMVSTDGHRLSKVERPLKGGPKLSAGVIIPKKGLIEIKRTIEGAEACSLAIKTPYAFIKSQGTTLAVKLIESQFPPYQQVIPEANNQVVTLEKNKLNDALKRALLMSSETRGVRVRVTKDHIEISSDNPDIGEVKEDLDSDYKGEDLTIGFNPRYVLDMLAQIKQEKIELALAGELDPVLVRPKGDDAYIGVVMPMRI